MKHILIPTDLSVQSLNALNAVVATHKEDTPLKITLFHLLKTPVSFSELLLRNSRYKYYEAISSDFHDACNVLQNKHGEAIRAIHIQFGFGDTSNYLKNYFESEKVDMIALMKEVELGLPFKNSARIEPLLKKLNVQYLDHPKKSYSDMNVINMNDFKRLNTHQNEMDYAKAK